MGDSLSYLDSLLFLLYSHIFSYCTKHVSGALLLTDNRQFIGFLHQQNSSIATDINLLGLNQAD